MTQALYRTWRPRSWEEVVGQEHVVQTLRNAVSGDRMAHAYLFAGPRGTGKTTTARLLAKAANCLHEDLAARPCNQCDHCQAVNHGHFLDLIEIDAASNTSVEDVRSLRDKINFSPNQGRYKVYIIDEVHMLSTAAFNALLKTLEEPPSHAIFILATTEVHKIPATVLSRCQRHEFRRIPVADIVAQLRALAEGEAFQVDSEALTQIARQATGSLRDAISLLDQLASSGEAITLELAQLLLGTATNQAVVEMVEALLAKDTAAGLSRIHQALDAGSDPRQFARQIVDYLRNLILVHTDNSGQIEAAPEAHAQMARQAQGLSLPDLLRIIRLFNQAAGESRSTWHPALPLELAFIDSVEVALPEREVEIERHQPALARSQPGPPVRNPAQPDRSLAETPPKFGEDPAQPGLPGALTIDAVIQNWRKVLALVRQRNPQTQGLLNSCKPLGVKDGFLVLGFNSDFVRSKMEKTEHLEIAHQVLQQVLGVEAPLRCIVVSGKQGTPPSDVDSDGMVATALRDLGGEIVDMQ